MDDPIAPHMKRRVHGWFAEAAAESAKDDADVAAWKKTYDYWKYDPNRYIPPIDGNDAADMTTSAVVLALLGFSGR